MNLNIEHHKAILVETAMTHTQGHRKSACELLGISSNTLRTYIRNFGLYKKFPERRDKINKKYRK